MEMELKMINKYKVIKNKYYCKEGFGMNEWKEVCSGSGVLWNFCTSYLTVKLKKAQYIKMTIFI